MRWQDRIEIYCDDCRERLKQIADNSIDACCTDPPYHLVSIVKRFGSPTAKPVRVGDISATNDLKAAHARAAAGFMGKTWDGGDIAFRPETWAAVYRVLKPGAHLLCFGGTRTYHRMACAIEDAGFEIRDCIQWIYGSGFPKSHNQGNGWGTALKPACEPIVLARKPLSEKTVAANVLKWGTGAINVDGCRIPSGQDHADKCASVVGLNSNRNGDCYGEWTGTQTDSFSTAGRWPSNVIHDGSDEVVGMFPANAGGAGKASGPTLTGKSDSNSRGRFNGVDDTPFYGDEGSAARFFYTAKADSHDRIGSKHPTVKPLDLMQYLVRLVTPKAGMVLDLFAGTGTTGEAAFREGMRAILIEREQEYIADIKRRMDLLMSGSDERTRQITKQKMKDKPADHGPLFSGQMEKDEWDEMWSKPFDRPDLV